MNSTIYDFSVNKINGTPAKLEEYKGKVLLVVNVASECGLTPQYEGLEKLYQKYSNKGFEVLAFPANEFGAQEPGSNSQIQEFCTKRFGVKFPMFEKIVVKGNGQHPLYQFLTQQKPEAILIEGDKFEKSLNSYGIFRESKADILWNFEKFLISKDGTVLARFAPDIKPENEIIIKHLEKALA